MFDRRDFMKMLGVGSVIAPVVAGVPSETQAVIVEPPKVEIVEALPISIANNFASMNACDVTLFVKQRDTGTVIRMDCQAFVSKFQRFPLEIPSANSPYIESYPGLSAFSFEATGQPKVVQIRR